MNRLLLLSLALVWSAGCVVRSTAFVPVPVKVKSQSLESSRKCHPSQYWDGTQCRHKGKGKGARKHDD